MSTPRTSFRAAVEARDVDALETTLASLEGGRHARAFVTHRVS